MAQKTEREVLNHLIQSCRDGELGFRTAAEHVTDPSLKAMFLELAAERAQVAVRLLPHAQRLGGFDAADGTSAGVLHRKWIDIKGALTRNDEHAIIVEVARGDRFTLDAFKDAIEGLLPPDTRDLVEQQYSTLQQEHAKLVEVESKPPVH